MQVAKAEALLDGCLYDPASFPATLEQVGDEFGYDYFGLISADFSSPRYILSARQREGLDAYFREGWGENDYRIRAESRTELGQLYLDHRDADEALRRQSVIYNEFFRQWDMANYAGVRLMINGAEWYCAAARSEARGVFNLQEGETFMRAAHAAVRTAAAISRLEVTLATGIMLGLERSGVAAILLDETARVSELTTAATALFNDDFNVRAGRLQAAAAGDMAALEKLAAMARRRIPSEPATFIIRGRSRGRAIQIEASPVVGQGLDDLVGGRLLLLLSDLGARDRDVVGEMSRRFRLSPAEADIVAHFADGRSIKQIAVRRRVAESTVREQMKSVYSKTGAHSQIDLLRLLDRFKP